MRLWVLTAQLDGEMIDTDSGSPCVGVFASLERAQKYLVEEWLKDDPEEAREIAWSQDPAEPYFMQAWDGEGITRYVLEVREVDEGMARHFDELGLPGGSAPMS